MGSFARIGLPDQTLACDCPMNQMCKADLLIGFYFDATTPDAKPDHRGADGSWTRSVA